jgi:cyclopropane-fatty-acyl-phospholipid synthase
MPSYLPSIVTNLIAYGVDLIRVALGSILWGPLLTISKIAVTSLFERIEHGTLVVIEEGTGKIDSYGRIANGARRVANGVSTKSASAGKVELKVIGESFWARLILFADMGFAEAYMLGEVECSDLTRFFEVSLL